MVAELGKIKVVPIKSVKPYVSNPRNIPPRAVEIVAKSLTEFGWQQPIVVDAAGVVVAGHTRLAAATSLGLSTVPVVEAADLTPEQIKAFRIVDNRTHDFSTWDFPELVTQLDELSAEFSEVLALEDWQGVVDQFKGLTDDAALELSSDLDGATATMTGFEVTVCFQTKEEALAAGPDLLELPGAFDVRNKF